MIDVLVALPIILFVYLGAQNAFFFAKNLQKYIELKTLTTDTISTVWEQLGNERFCTEMLVNNAPSYIPYGTGAIAGLTSPIGLPLRVPFVRDSSDTAIDVSDAIGNPGNIALQQQGIRVQNLKLRHLRSINDRTHLASVDIHIKPTRADFADRINTAKTIPITIETLQNGTVVTCYSQSETDFESSLARIACEVRGQDIEGTEFIYDPRLPGCIPRYKYRVITGDLNGALCPSDAVKAVQCSQDKISLVCPSGDVCDIERPPEDPAEPPFKNSEDLGECVYFGIQESAVTKGSTCTWLPGAIGNCEVRCAFERDDLS